MQKEMTILEEIEALHLLTIPGGVDASFRFRTDKTISYRLFRNHQYIKDIRCPTQSMSDVSIRVLLTAYIYGSWDIKKRETGPLAEIDQMLEYDQQFYSGLWDILTACITGKAQPKISALESFDVVDALYDDKELTDFAIKDSCDTYVMFCMMNDIKMSNRGFSRLVGLGTNFLEVHPTAKAKHGRREPVIPVLTLLFGCKRCIENKELAPANFWIDNIDNSWKYLHQSLINDLYLASEFHKEYATGKFGY